MTRERPELLTYICDSVTTLFYVILRRKSSEWLEWSASIESDLGMRFVIYGALTYPFAALLSFNIVSSVRTGY